MSRRDHVFNIENLDRWLEWLETLDQGSLDRLQSRILRTAGLRVLEYADDNTPTRTGRLKDSLNMGDKDNVFKLEIGGRTSYVVAGTAVEYAAHIEYGFSQEDRKGDFIPGYWRSGTFHYDPEAAGGMVLTGKVIPGAHMFKKAMDWLEGDLDTIAEFEFRRLYDELHR